MKAEYKFEIKRLPWGVFYKYFVENWLFIISGVMDMHIYHHVTSFEN